MFHYIALAENKPWQPGPYAGVELKILHKNEANGGVVVLRKFQAGMTIPAHTHPVANEWAWILSGEWEESAISYKPGTLFFAPKGTQHGPHVAKTEVVSLTRMAKAFFKMARWMVTWRNSACKRALSAASATGPRAPSPGAQTRKLVCTLRAPAAAAP